MTFEETFKFFNLKTYYALSKMLGVSKVTMSFWKKKGYIPWKHQFNLVRLSDGKLQADPIDPILVRRAVRDKEKINVEFSE